MISFKLEHLHLVWEKMSERKNFYVYFCKHLSYAYAMLI